MQDIAKGFRIGDRLVPWGATRIEAARILGLGEDTASSCEIAVPCALACGLPALSARLTGPAADRPVLSIAYDLADIGGLRPDDWVNALAEILGRPADLDRYGLSGAARSEDTVILHAGWALGEFRAGMSIFGAPRKIDHGRSVGTLWLSWSERAAAEPYLADWTGRSERLAASTRSLTDIRVYTLAWAGHPVYGTRHEGPEPEAERQDRFRRLSLHVPELLATPETIARRLSVSAFALWSNHSDGLWGASTLWETLPAPFGTPVAVDWIELRPAKGGGYSALEIGRWRVMSRHGAAEIAEAADRIRSFPGVKINRHDGYDC